jgi:hypothetical protein
MQSVDLVLQIVPSLSLQAGIFRLLGQPAIQALQQVAKLVLQVEHLVTQPLMGHAKLDEAGGMVCPISPSLDLQGRCQGPVPGHPTTFVERPLGQAQSKDPVPVPELDPSQ